MMKRMKAALVAGIFLGMASMAQSVCGLNVEDFESYADTSALAAQWQDTVGSPIQTLDASVFHGGSKSMKLVYDCGVSPFENQVTYSFGANQNWSAYDQFHVFVRSVEGATSLEHLTFQLKDEFGGTLGSSQIGTQIGNTWTDWSVDLTSFTNLANVRQISFDVSAFDVNNGFGQGTLYFDDMSVVAAIPEPGTATLLSIGILGLLAVGNARRVLARRG